LRRGCSAGKIHAAAHGRKKDLVSSERGAEAINKLLKGGGKWCQKGPCPKRPSEGKTLLKMLSLIKGGIQREITK